MIALTLLLIIFGYILVSIVVGYLIYRFSKRRLSFFTASGILLIIPVVFSLILYLPNYIRLQTLCNSPERSFIKKTAHVDGYVKLESNLCHMNWPVLFEPGYQYYECEKARDSLSGPDREAGLYRYSLGQKEQEGCMEFKHFMRDTKDKYKKRMQGLCLISERVEEIKSQYGRKHQRGHIENGIHIYGDSDLPNSQQRDMVNFISFYEDSIIDRKTGEIISIVKNYKFWPLLVGNDMGSFQCSEYKTVNTSNVLVITK